MGRFWGFLLVLSWGGCRGPVAELSPEPSDGTVPGEGGSDSGSAETTSSASTQPQNNPVSVADAGERATDGGAGSVGEGCGAQSVTLAEIHAGKVRGTLPVAVKGLVASSQKFLVSEAKSGSCLWGAFAAAEGEQGVGSGLFLVSFGAPHADGDSCVAGSDGLPDDWVPGERVEVEGKLDEYAPASCAATAPAQQLMIDAACPLRRLGSGAAPEPAVIDTALANRLALGKDQQLLRDWGGALVRLEGVTAVQDTDDGDAVFPFGVVRLEQTSLEVHSRLYYFDLSEGGPRASVKAPHYAYPTAFGGISGIVFLDYCSWVLAPRDRCSDLEPASSGCAAQAQRP